MINISIDGQRVEQVSKFKYLGAWIIKDGSSETKMKTRLGMARDIFSKTNNYQTRRVLVAIARP